jgi:hypothetical protein
MRVIRFLILVAVAVLLPLLFVWLLSSCSAVEAKVKQFNASALGKRVDQDAAAAASAAATGAANETLDELETGGKLDQGAIGAAAGTAAATALINLDIQRAQAKATGK